MGIFDSIKFEVLRHEDALIAQALGKDCSVHNEDGDLEAYQYNGKVYILDWTAKRGLK